MERGAPFDRTELMDAFERIGRAAVANGTRLELAVYGGSALMMASNFRYATEDVDIAEIDRPWPSWFAAVTADLARERGWNEDWINDAVQFHLSPLASKAVDHIEFGMFPSDAEGTGLAVLVPSPEYMLALKVKAMRTTDPVKGPQETDDIVNLMRVLEMTTPDQAIATMARFFPKSGATPERQRFLLRNLQATGTGKDVHAPSYGR